MKTRRLCARWKPAVLAGALALVIPVGPATARDLHVSKDGSDANSGLSTGAPFRTVQHACDQMRTGDTVWVRGGTYREYVLLDRSGAESVPLSLSGYGDEWPELKGSDVVTNWTHETNFIWKATNWIFNCQQVFENGAPLRQVGMPNDYLAGETYIYTPALTAMTNGSFLCDRTNRCLYIWLSGNTDPSGSVIEASIRTHLLFTGYTNEFLELRHLEARHNNSVAYSLAGLMGVNIGEHSVIDNCRVQWCDGAGISAKANARFMNTDISHNGFEGAGWSGTNVEMRGCTVLSNNYRGFNEDWSAAGLKVIPPVNEFGRGAAGGIVESNEIAWNYGYAVWFDTCTETSPIIIRNNYIHHNGAFPGHAASPAAVMLEVTKGARVCNNLIVSNRGIGCWVAASDNVKVFNNVLVGTEGYNEIRVADIPRWISQEHNEWATLVSNEVVNNVVMDSRCLFIFTLPPESTNPSTFATGNRSDYNVVYNSGGYMSLMGVQSYNTLTGWAAATGWDGHSLTNDPALATTGENPYSPSSDSPVVDRGTACDGVVSDRRGTPRPLDGDGNGVAAPDMGAYEYVNPEADTDVDHFNDLAEIIAGTSPLDKADYFRLESIAVGEWVSLRLLSKQGRLYGVEASTDLLDGVSWTVVSNNLAGTGDPLLFMDTSGFPERFYRISVRRP